jgi:uncharacterized delta-60 repeat protein
MKSEMFLIYAILILNCLLICPNTSQAQNGSLDLSFGNAGKVITDVGNEDGVSSVAVQTDGKILVAGVTKNATNYDFALVRYNTNGTLDNLFGNGGIVTTDIDSSETAYSMAIQSDGKIVLAGLIVNQDFALVRYNSNGTLDNTFGTGGKLITDISGTASLLTAVVIQNDGKIVLASKVHQLNDDDIVLIRYNSNGTLDNTFGNGGIQTTDIAGANEGAYSIALQTDSKIVVCGSSSAVNTKIALLRYNTNGTLDNTFGIGGIQTTTCGIVALGYSVAIQSDGKIVVGGETMSIFPDRDFVLLRYKTNGTLDSTFGNGGITITQNDSLDNGQTIAIQSNGKILFGGRTKSATNFDFRLDCYNIDGTLDSTFGNAGTTVTDILGNEGGASLAIQSDGKIVMAGYNNNANALDFVVTRYIYTNDAPDCVGNIISKKTEIKSYPNPFSTQTTIQLKTEILDAQLLLYDLLGHQVNQVNHLYGKEIKLNRDNLPAGIYTIQLKQGTKTIGRDKVIIID